MYSSFWIMCQHLLSIQLPWLSTVVVDLYTVLFTINIRTFKILFVEVG